MPTQDRNTNETTGLVDLLSPETDASAEVAAHETQINSPEARTESAESSYTTPIGQASTQRVELRSQNSEAQPIENGLELPFRAGALDKLRRDAASIQYHSEQAGEQNTPETVNAQAAKTEAQVESTHHQKPLDQQLLNMNLPESNIAG